MSKRRKLKICVGASAGGHMNELFRLLDASKDVWPEEPSLYITTQPLLREKLAQRGKVYVLGEANRQHPLMVISVFL